MNAIDLFSGAGGMSLGFERAGFRVLAAFDHDPKHVTTYAANFPTTPARIVDISTLTAEAIHKVIGHEQTVDLVYGGPPCQGFSVGGRQQVEDPRNELLMQFARIVCELRPRAFVAENVDGILAAKYRPLLATFFAQMTRAGYTLLETPFILNAKDFNVPQARRRVFFVGVLNPRWLPARPRPVYTQPELRNPTVQAAIGDMPMVGNMDDLFQQDRYGGPLGEPSAYTATLRIPRNQENATDSIGGFLRTRHSEDVLERFAATAPGEREPVSRFYRLAWDGVAPTLRAGTTYALGKYMAPRPIHPTENRVITVREAARLHSYPDWFEFHPTKWYGFMQVGNSVPPLMAEAVAYSILQGLSNN